MLAHGVELSTSARLTCNETHVFPKVQYRAHDLKW